jgi:hypothetical protein
MTNDLDVFKGFDLTDEKALRDAVAADADVGSRADGLSFMSFSGKRGTYKIGLEEREPGKEEPFLLAVPLFKIGWICWKGGKPVAKRMAGLRQPAVPEPDMSEFGPFDSNKGEGWMRARSVQLKSMDNNEEVEFSISSKSGVAEIASMHKMVRDQMGEGAAYWPAIVFGREEFEAQGFKNFKPTMEVVKWLTTDEIKQWVDDFDALSLLDAPKEETPAPAPARRRL